MKAFICWLMFYLMMFTNENEGRLLTKIMCIVGVRVEAEWDPEIFDLELVVEPPSAEIKCPPIDKSQYFPFTEDCLDIAGPDGLLETDGSAPAPDGELGNEFPGDGSSELNQPLPHVPPLPSKNPTAPGTSGASETPDTSGTPDASETPDTPGTSDASETPDIPGTSDASETPDASGTPDASETPDASGTPDASETPGESSDSPPPSTKFKQSHFKKVYFLNF